MLDRHRRDSDEVKHSGRPTVRTEEVVQRVKESVEKSLHRSTRQRCQIVKLKRTTLRRVLHQDLNVFPYRLQVLHTLTQIDKDKRVEMSEWLAKKIEDSPNWIRRVWFSDEAHFKLNGDVNSKNAVHWGSEKPDYVLQKPLHSLKCTAWVAISHKGIIGPFWFQDDDGNSETINTERYLEVLERFWEALNVTSKKLDWFQQDGASCHASNDSLKWIKERFKSRVISRRCDPFWAPHSPDLSPPDFFLWGYLKDRCYKNHPQTIADLQTDVENEIKAIPATMRAAVISNFCVRINLCLARNGGHLEHVL